MTPPSQKPIALSLSLVALAALAGCLGDGGAAADVPATSDDTGTMTGASAGGAAGLASDPAGAAAPGALPHIHDYWNGRERVTLLDDDFESDAETVAMFAFYSTLMVQRPMAGGAFVSLPPGQTVFEGTGRMEVTVTWTDPTIGGFQMLYRDASSATPAPFGPVANGEPIVIEVSPEMTDMPHAKSSRWGFLFAADGVPPVALGTFHVKIDIVKTRDLTTYPGHPDLWHGADALVLKEASGEALGRDSPQDTRDRSMNGFNPPTTAITGGAPVPMETGVLFVNVTVTGVEPAVVPLDALLLRVQSPEAIGYFFPDAPPTVDGAAWSWRIPVTMAATDSPYATESGWVYHVQARFGEAGVACPAGCLAAKVTFDMTVTAVKAPPLEEAAA